MLGAGERMAGNELDMLWQVRRHRVDDRMLGRADIGHHCAGFQHRGDLGRHSTAGSDGNADDDKIGIARGLGRTFRNAVAEPQFDCPCAGLRRTGVSDNLS